MDARVSTPQPADPADRPIGELFHQLVDDGRTLASAEVNLYKQIALYRIGKAKNGVVALVVAGVLLHAALIACFVGFVMGIADWIGPVAAGLAVLVLSGIVAFVLFRYGAGKMAALSGDPEEKAALQAGEQRR